MTENDSKTSLGGRHQGCFLYGVLLGMHKPSGNPPLKDLFWREGIEEGGREEMGREGKGADFMRSKGGEPVHHVRIKVQLFSSA